MYQNEIAKLKVALDATEVLIEGLGNIYAAVDSISLNIEPLARSLDSLLFSKQNLVAQIKILEDLQTKAADELALTMEK